MTFIINGCDDHDRNLASLEDLEARKRIILATGSVRPPKRKIDRQTRLNEASITTTEYIGARFSHVLHPTL